ncbi:MAG: radical SAM protein [Syntrophaceae bacterium]
MEIMIQKNDPKYVVKRALGQAPLLKGGRAPIEQIDIELTERCNNNCIHCCINRPAADLSAGAGEMKTEQVRDFLRQAADLGCLRVRFTGGEPLLRPDFEELYIHARRLGLLVSLFTNACLITPRLADTLQHVPPRGEIEITAYGMHRDSYEAVTRSPGSFARFRNGLDLLRERQVPFIIRSVLLPPNSHEIDQLADWAGTVSGMPGKPGQAFFLDLRNRRDDEQKNARIRSLRLTAREMISVMARDAAQYRKDMEAFAAQFMGPPGDRLFKCGAGKAVCIDSYGKLQPCMGLRMPEWTIDLTSGKATLKEALARWEGIGSLCARNPEYLRRCARCFLNGLCEQCPAKSWMEHGDLDTPVEYFCEMSHAQARYLGWLGRDEKGWEVMNWQERIAKQRSDDER